jgi:hypothetical protein
MIIGSYDEVCATMRAYNISNSLTTQHNDFSYLIYVFYVFEKNNSTHSMQLTTLHKTNERQNCRAGP